MLQELLRNPDQALLFATIQFDKQTFSMKLSCFRQFIKPGCTMESNFIMLVMLNDKRS